MTTRSERENNSSNTTGPSLKNDSFHAEPTKTTTGGNSSLLHGLELLIQASDIRSTAQQPKEVCREKPKLTPEQEEVLFTAFYRWGGSLENREAELAAMAHQMGVDYDLLVERLHHAMKLVAQKKTAAVSPSRPTEQPTTLPSLGDAISSSCSSQCSDQDERRDDTTDEEEQVTDGEDKVDEEQLMKPTGVKGEAEEKKDHVSASSAAEQVSSPSKKPTTISRPGKRRERTGEPSNNKRVRRSKADQRQDSNYERVGETPFSSVSAVSPEQQHFVLQRLKQWKGDDLYDALDFMEQLAHDSGISIHYIHWVFSQTRGAPLLNQHASQITGPVACQRPGPSSHPYPLSMSDTYIGSNRRWTQTTSTTPSMSPSLHEPTSFWTASRSNSDMLSRASSSSVNSSSYFSGTFAGDGCGKSRDHFDRPHQSGFGSNASDSPLNTAEAINKCMKQELELLQQKYHARVTDLESELGRCKDKLLAAEERIAELAADNRMMSREREELLEMFRGQHTDWLKQTLFNSYRNIGTTTKALSSR